MRGQSASSAKWRRSSSLFSRRLPPAAAAGEYVPVPACADIAGYYGRAAAGGLVEQQRRNRGRPCAGLAGVETCASVDLFLLPCVAFARVFGKLGPMGRPFPYNMK